MSEVHVNNPTPVVVEDRGGDRAAAAGINFLTVVVALIVIAALVWFLFTVPFRNGFPGPSTTNVNVQPPAQQAPNVNVQPPNVNVQPPNVEVKPPAKP